MNATTWNPPAVVGIATDIGNQPPSSAKPVQESAVLVGVVPPMTDQAQMTDDQLMTALCTGDSHALEALYDRHVRGCFGLAMKIVRDPSVAEEVVQDVFMKLWSQPDRFTPERGKFSGWLLTLIHNRSVDKLRRTRSQAGNSVPLESSTEAGVKLADLIPDGGPTPYDDAWRSEKGGLVREALAKLTDAQRQAITLAYFGGLTQKEIAESLHEPLGTIKTRTRAALHQMRRVLDTQGLLGDLR